MIRVTSSGDFNNTKKFINRFLSKDIYRDLDRYGRMGIDALAKATPIDSGITKDSWGYRIIKDKRRPGIEWFSTNEINGTPIAILIQYGHATGTGGYVHGRDFINPTMRPVFDKIADDVWKKVKA